MWATYIGGVESAPGPPGKFQFIGFFLVFFFFFSELL